MRRNSIAVMALLASVVNVTLADGPKDNMPDQVRRVPQLGIEVPEDKRAQLRAGAQTLGGKAAADEAVGARFGSRSCVRRRDLSSRGERCSRVSGVLQGERDRGCPCASSSAESS